MAESPPAPVRDDGFSGPDDLPLELRRMPNPGRPPVLLLHGASAQHETFCIPRRRSLSEYLWKHDYEPWLLDWRGSRRVTDALERSGELHEKRNVLDFDCAAEKDVSAALARIAEVRDHQDAEYGEVEKHRVHVVAHCMGAGVLAQAIALGDVPLDRLGRVVLLTLGLFYETPLDGKVKSQFHVLDRLWRAGSVSVIDPRKPEKEEKWPRELQKIYEEIGTRWRPHPLGDLHSRSSHALCNRVSFMYGTPYRHSNLVQEIHGVARVRFAKGDVDPGRGERLCAVPRANEADDVADYRTDGLTERLTERLTNHQGVAFVSEVHLESGSWRAGNAEGTLELSGSVGKFPVGCDLWADDVTIGACGGKTRHDGPAQLGKQFGAIPLRMYLQGAQNVRRRWAGPFVETAKASVDAQSDTGYIGPEAVDRFRSLPAVTLITGAQNQLWHCDSINRMYEWLTRGLKPDLREKFHKVVLPNYAHQDLLWGVKAKEDVFPLVLERGLGGPGTAIAFEPAEPGTSFESNA